MVTVAELVTDLNVRGDGGKRLQKFGLTLTDLKAGLDIFVGGVRIAADFVREFTTELANAGDEAAKTAKNLGIGVQAVQELDFAAKLAGQDVNAVRTAIQRMQKGLNDARVRGTGPFADGLKQLGLRLEDFDGQKPNEIFENLAEALANTEDATTKAALAQDFFGRGGKTLLPLLNEGADGIRAMREEFQALGGGFTDDGAASAEEFNDEMLRLNTVIDSVKIAVGEELFPVITDIVTAVRDWALQNKDAVKQELVEFINQLIANFKAMGPELITVTKLMIDWTLQITEAIGGVSELTDENEGLLAQLRSDWPTAFGIAEAAVDGIVTTVKTMINPVGAIINLIGDLVAEIDRLLESAEIGFRISAALGLDEGETGLQAIEEGRRRAEDKLARRARARAQKSKDAEKHLARFDKASSKNLQRIADDNEQPAVVRETAALLAPLRAVQENTRDELEFVGPRLVEPKPKKTGKGGRRGGRRGGKRSGGGRIASSGTKTKTDEEFFADLERNISEGRGLEDLFKADSASKATPPVVSINIQNFDVDQTIAVEIDVSGVPGQDAESIANIVNERVRETLSDEFRRAVEDLEPTVSR